jgi:hypothetical protein
VGEAYGLARGRRDSQREGVVSTQQVSVCVVWRGRGSSDGWVRCRYNHPHDVHLVAFTELLRIVWRFHQQVYSDPKAPNGLNKVG